MTTVPSAKVICDSISPDGVRLTTMEITCHRYILAELNTHRVFSRNSASSRAIPTPKLIQRVLDDPALPAEWGSNQRGMQAGEPISTQSAFDAKCIWLESAHQAAWTATRLSEMGIHKQVVNRVLEPYLWHTVIVTATDWDNFFAQRCSRFSPLAAPEMRAVADAMYEAYQGCRWDAEPLGWGDWHLPYLSAEERVELTAWGIAKQVSAARCARVSYLTHDGVRDFSVDLDLYNKLVSARPIHFSPLEHVAHPCTCWPDRKHLGNFRGWDQLRHMVTVNSDSAKELTHA